jgi:hypothetical protein
MKKVKFGILGILVLIFFVGCAGNTTPTNIGVTAYETSGAMLTQSYNSEKLLLATGAITAAQDSQFQLGVYKDAVDCYKALGSAAVAVLTATDSSGKTTATDKFNLLNAQLPGLISKVIVFIQDLQIK